MSLALASVSIEKQEVFLPDPPATDVPPANRGMVTLRTSGGVTISSALRGNIGRANKSDKIKLPIGSFDFTLNHVPVGGTAELRIDVPAGALDPNNPEGFVEKDQQGNLVIKSGLNWFKIQSGAWKGIASVPIRIELNQFFGGAIFVTLRDGGPEDKDGTANGQIVDPAAPGVGAEEEAGGGSSEKDKPCFIATAAYGSSMADDVVMLRNFRDKYLLTNALGRAFVSIYYRVSPPMARFIARHENMRTATRVVLAPVVNGVKHPLLTLVFFSGAVLGVVVIRRRRRS